MVSETFVARDVFSSIWNLGLLGALQSATPVKFPFNEQLRQFVHKHSKDWGDLLSIVRCFCGFSREVMSVATELSPWNEHSFSQSSFTPERLTGEILLAAHSDSWIEIDFDDLESVHFIAQHAKRLQYVALMNGVLQARFSFCVVKTPFAQDLEKLLRCALIFADETVEYGDSAMTTVSETIHRWTSENNSISVEENEPGFEYQTWVAEIAIPELVRAFD